MKKLLAVVMSAMLTIPAVPVFAESTAAQPDPIDMSAWQYEASDDVYWQTGLSYAATPADANYETMGIFVPGSYFNAEDNGDGTYTCTVNEEGTAGNYTAQNAPYIIPVNTPGYSAMSAPTDYSSSNDRCLAPGAGENKLPFTGFVLSFFIQADQSFMWRPSAQATRLRSSWTPMCVTPMT